jgi:hypothetical protein
MAPPCGRSSDGLHRQHALDEELGLGVEHARAGHRRATDLAALSERQISERNSNPE